MPEATARATSSNRSGRARLILILGALTAFGPLSIDMYLPAFPALEDYFQTTTGAVQATLAVFFVGLAVGQVIYGPLSDRYGRKAPLLVGCALYVLASVAALFASDIWVLAGARLVQALGACAGIVISRAVVRDMFDEQESAKAYSLLMLVMGAAPILAPLGGGQLLAFFGWQAIFMVLTLFGAACFLAVMFLLPETLPTERRSTGGIGQALAAFLTLLKDRAFVGYTFAGGLVLAGLFAYITGSPFVFIELHGVSPQAFGFVFGINAIGIIGASQVNVMLLKHFSSHAILRTMLFVNMAAGLSLLVIAHFDVGGLVLLMVPLFVVVSSMGFIGANAAAAAMARARDHAGGASALIGMLQFALGAVAAALVGSLANGTAMPMAIAIALLGVTAVLMHEFVATRGGATA